MSAKDRGIGIANGLRVSSSLACSPQPQSPDPVWYGHRCSPRMGDLCRWPGCSPPGSALPRPRWCCPVGDTNACVREEAEHWVRNSGFTTLHLETVDNKCMWWQSHVDFCYVNMRAQKAAINQPDLLIQTHQSQLNIGQKGLPASHTPHDFRRSAAEIQRIPQCENQTDKCVLTFC